MLDTRGGDRRSTFKDVCHVAAVGVAFACVFRLGFRRPNADRGGSDTVVGDEFTVFNMRMHTRCSHTGVTSNMEYTGKYRTLLLYTACNNY
jgi:hypothetical protein